MEDHSRAGQDEPRHPIAVVAERTGLSQDILRVWERRYTAVRPSRGSGGQRLYSDSDVERLSLLHAATRAGRSISSVVGLSTEAIAALVGDDIAARERRPAAAPPMADAPDIIGSALVLARRLDSAGLDDLLRRSAVGMGMLPFIETVVVPLLRRVGDEWHAGVMTIAQEHLISSLLNDIVAERIRSFAAHSAAPRILITTPAGERHAIGALLVGVAAAIEGWNVLDLGVDLPADEIADAAISADVRLVAISVVFVEHRHGVLAELSRLRSRLPHTVSILVGGAGAAALAPELSAIGITVQSTIHGLIAELRRAREMSA
ncbi:MAG: MerR family transcriptional regulator [bacterium]